MKKIVLVTLGAVLLLVVAGLLWEWWNQLSYIYEESTGLVKLSAIRKVVASFPDEFVTLVFVLRNLSDQEHSYELRAEVPQGWMVLDELATVELRPHSQQELFLTVQVPPATRRGRYQVRVFAQSNSFSAWGRSDIIVRAREHFKLTLAPSSDLIARLNQEKTVMLTVTNRGNVSTRVSLAVTAAPVGWQFQLRESSVMLAPGQSQTVELTVRSLQDAAIVPARFTVQAASTSIRDELSFTVVPSP